MRISEIICESKDDHELIHMAELIADKIVKVISGLPENKRSGELFYEKIGNLVSNDLFPKTGDYLEYVNVVVEKLDSVHGGVFSYPSREVRVNSSYLSYDDSDKSHIKSILVHELRHALDFMKFKYGKIKKVKEPIDLYRGEIKSRIYPGERYTVARKKEHREDKSDFESGYYGMDYYAQPQEINARITELEQELNKKAREMYAERKHIYSSDVRYLRRSARHWLDYFNIDKVYPEGVQSKYFRRILTRLYKFIDEMVEIINRGASN
jgi:hypothetical protein